MLKQYVYRQESSSNTPYTNVSQTFLSPTKSPPLLINFLGTYFFENDAKIIPENDWNFNGIIVIAILSSIIASKVARSLTQEGT
jgi:hypothetical protein